MDIHFVSTLTQEDERRIASVLIAALGKLLAQSALSYALRIQTSAGDVLQDSWTGIRDDDFCTDDVPATETSDSSGSWARRGPSPRGGAPTKASAG